MMNSDELVCRKCGDTVFDAAKHGAYLKRVNKKGDEFIGECSPSCDKNHGTSADAIINAVDER
jgi:hypothetical protein